MVNKYTKTIVDIDLMIQLYESGLSQTEVAEQMGITQKIVYSRFKEIGYQCRKQIKRNQRGSNNDSWKGDKATYAAFHYRVIAVHGQPMKCDDCGTTDKDRTYEWANKTGKYNDVNDYVRLCKQCHHRLDIKSHKRNELGQFVKMGGDANA